MKFNFCYTFHHVGPNSYIAIPLALESHKNSAKPMKITGILVGKIQNTVIK